MPGRNVEILLGRCEKPKNLAGSFECKRNSNYKTLHTSPLLGKDSGLIELFDSLPDRSSK
jgi:hypothetical protein